MAHNGRQDGASSWGHVTIWRCGEPFLLTSGVGDASIAEQSRYTWWPKSVLSAELPAEFRIAMDCVTGRDGLRRFAPAGGIETFLLEASLGGLAILSKSRGLDAEGRFAYHTMRLLFQHAPRLRERFDRSFKRESDLWIAGAERAGRGGKDILPARVGLDREGRGRRWTVTELLHRGRDQILEAGDPNPDPGRCIAVGLLAAARLDPLDPSLLSGSEALGLVRMALFDLGPAGGIAEADKQVVTDRLLEFIESHIEDDSA